MTVAPPPGAASDRPPPWVAYLGTTGLFGFALFAFLGIAGANIGLGLMILGVLFDWRRFWGALRSDPILGLMLWCLAAVALSAGLRAWRFPDELAQQLHGVLQVLQLFFFLPLAWWLRGRRDWIRWLLALALLGLVLGVARALDGPQLTALLALQRPNFLWSINAVAQYSAAALLGLVLFTPRYWRWLAGRRWRWPALLAWLALLGLAGGLVLLSLSRGVWLALLLVMAGLLIQLAWAQRRNPLAGRRLVRAGLAGVVLGAGLIALSEPVRQRLVETVEPAIQLWAQDGATSGISDYSARVRARLLRLGLDSWLAQPWLGAGPHAPERIIREHREQFRHWRQYTDFHSLPVDLLVSYGVLGALPLLLTLIRVLWVARRGHARGHLERDLYLVLVGLLLLSVLAQLTDTRILDSHGRFYSILVAGSIYSWRLASYAKPSARR